MTKKTSCLIDTFTNCYSCKIYVCASFNNLPTSYHFIGFLQPSTAMDDPSEALSVMSVPILFFFGPFLDDGVELGRIS